MKNIFDIEQRALIEKRIQLLTVESQPLWGKMDIYQMLIHCRRWSDWIHGKGEFERHTYKQDFLGKLFGKMALKNTIKNDRVMGKNLPAGLLTIKDKQSYDISIEKARWIQSVKEYEDFGNERFIHDFFGKMTKEQIGIFVYKHFDHHLRQFGV